jgi:hypothetical protein
MKTRTRSWLLFGLVVTLSVAWVAVPVWLLQPFAPQTPLTVEWSWQLRRAAPIATALFAFASLALAARLWRATAPAGATGTPRADDLRRTIARVALVVLAAASAGTAWFARQNHFEWMFRPFPDARFVAAADAGDLPADAPVIGVAADGQALAFPITRIGYHHLVNTTLGDVPIVATY